MLISALLYRAAADVSAGAQMSLALPNFILGECVTTVTKNSKFAARRLMARLMCAGRRH